MVFDDVDSAEEKGHQERFEQSVRHALKKPKPSSGWPVSPKKSPVKPKAKRGRRAKRK